MTTAVLEVVKPGWLTTVQDLGRWGLQGRGVSVAGPMDAFSHRLVNRVLGNPVEAATLEITMSGPELRCGRSTWLAVSGAEFPVTLDGVPMPMHRPVRVAAGATVRFGTRRRGTRGYLGVAGGFPVAPVLRSRATHTVSGLGGWQGRALRAGDRIPIAEVATDVPECDAASVALVIPDGPMELRAMRGPHQHYFTPETIAALYERDFIVSVHADRMGYRLEGTTLPWRSDAPELISGPTMAGALQVPASGAPVLLMADRATTGGYPIAVVVVAADLPLAGQLGPGDTLRFTSCTRREALSALRERFSVLENPCLA